MIANYCNAHGLGRTEWNSVQLASASPAFVSRASPASFPGSLLLYPGYEVALYIASAR